MMYSVTDCKLVRRAHHHALEIGSTWPQSGVLWKWSQVLGPSQYLAFTEYVLKAEDFELQEGFFLTFDHEGAACLLHAPNCEPFFMPMGYLYACLGLLLRSTIECSGDLFADQPEASRSDMVDKFLRECEANSSAYGVHGLPKIDEQPLVPEANYLRHWRLTFLHREPFYPSMDTGRLFEILWVKCAEEFGSSRYYPGSSRHLSPGSEIVELLKIGRMWGETIPITFYDPRENPASVISTFVESYHDLLSYAQVTLNKLGLVQRLNQIPLGIGWFFRIQPKLPDGWNPVEFTEFCELVFTRSSPTSPMSIETDVMGWKVRLNVFWIALDRLGLVDVTMVYDLAEDDLDDYVYE